MRIVQPMFVLRNKVVHVVNVVFRVVAGKECDAFAHEGGMDL